MSTGNKQIFNTGKATGKKSKSALLFFPLLETYNKEELMAYASSPQNKTTKIHVSILFFSFAKKQKRKCKSAFLAFPFLQLQQDRCCKLLVCNNVM